jgi:hypothetical protein
MIVGSAGQLRAVEGVLAGAGYAYRPVHKAQARNRSTSRTVSDPTAKATLKGRASRAHIGESTGLCRLSDQWPVEKRIGGTRCNSTFTAFCALTRLTLHAVAGG